MYEQLKGDILFCMFYAAVAILPLAAGFYLWFRRANAFAPQITSPVRLRRWMAAFFACLTLSHVWYIPILFQSSKEEALTTYLIGGLLDSLTVFPLSLIVLLVMMQDRRRPLWPAVALMLPVIGALIWSIANCSDALFTGISVYSLLLSIFFFIYMVRALRQYGHWLRDNYADLEHKEVWQNFIVLVAIQILFGFYAFSVETLVFQYIMQMTCIVLVFYLLWRVETLSDLHLPENEAEDDEEVVAIGKENEKTLPAFNRNDIGQLLKSHCEDKQLYLQQGISVAQMAKKIGTNRLYLGRYLSSQGVTYNTYINELRIRHFIALYHKTSAAHQPLVIKNLASQSGFSSYSTFGLAFKQVMGMTATEWMRTVEPQDK